MENDSKSCYEVVPYVLGVINLRMGKNVINQV